jgi:NAD-dependent SIR2 family protein deacetylase
MFEDEAHHLIEKIRSSTFILVVVGAGLSRSSGIPTFRDDAWFWERPIEESATDTAFRRDPLYVWAMYERLRLLANNALPNPGHVALARLARAKPNLLTVSQNVDGTFTPQIPLYLTDIPYRTLPESWS